MKPFRETGGVSSVLFPKGLSSRTAWQDSGALPNLPFLGSPQCGRSSKFVQNIPKEIFLLQHPSSCGPKTKTAKPCQPLVLVVELQIWVANFGPSWASLGRLKISTVDWFLGTCSTCFNLHWGQTFAWIYFQRLPVTWLKSKHLQASKTHFGWIGFWYVFFCMADDSTISVLLTVSGNPLDMCLIIYIYNL